MTQLSLYLTLYLQKVYGKDGMPRGRPNWVDGKVPPVCVF
jgi:hypothetical protein